MNLMFLSLGARFSSLLVNFGQNNSLFRPIQRACGSMDSCIYLRQWITNMFKYYSQSIQPSVVCFGHFSLILGMYNWIYCPNMTKALMIKDCIYKASIETLQNTDNIQTDISQLICFDFYCSKLKHIFPVLAEKPSFFGRNTSFEGLKGHFICCTTAFYCPFTNMPSLNSKFQICHPNFVYGQFLGNFHQFWASWWKYGLILTTSGCLKQNLIH